MSADKKISWPARNAYQKRALALIRDLQRIEPQTFAVGGAVRDALLGTSRDLMDIDIATALEPAQTKRALKKLGVPFFNVGEKYGTVGALLSGRAVEITTFRKESGYADYRHPGSVRFVRSSKDDAGRRDFTMNALYFDPATHLVHDYFTGIGDIAKRLIRFVGTPKRRITEDPLRMLRAVRFAVELDFKLDPAARAAIKKHAALIQKISGDRIKRELDRIMASDRYMEGVRLLDATGLFKAVFPELERLKKVRQSKNFHAEGNVFIHTLKVLEFSRAGDRTFRYAALFHDLGKFGTAHRTRREGRPHISFLNHAAVGAQIFAGLTRRMPFSAAEKDRIEYLIEHHMHLTFRQPVADEKLIKQAQNRHFEDLIMLRIADTNGSVATDSAGRPFAKDIAPLRALQKKFRRWQPLLHENIIDGEEIMRALKLRPGKKVGEILDRIKFLRISGKIKTKTDARKFLKTLDSKS